MDRAALNPNTATSPEFDLLLLCARTKIDETELAQARDLLKREIHWPSLLQLANDHHVLPLVERSLGQFAQALIPESLTNQLREQSAAILRQNLFRLGHLIHVLELLNAHRIRAIPYKGPAVAALAYGNVGLRRFGDLDILVHPGDYFRARDLLLSDGCSLVDDRGNECCLMDDTHGHEVDLHRALMPGRVPFDLDFDRCHARCQPVVVGGRQITTFSPEDTLLVLCVQLVKDASGTPPLFLIKICDIAELLRAHPGMNWDDVVSEAGRLGGLGILSFGLSIARRFLRAPIPEHHVMVNRLAQRDWPSPSRHLGNKLIRERAAGYVPVMSANRFNFSVRERWRDKLSPYRDIIKKRVTPNERDRALIRLPAALGVLYYGVRPVRLARDFLGRRKRT